MNLSEAHDLARDLAERALDPRAEAFSGGADRLVPLDGRDWLLLDEAARTYRHLGMPVSGARGWLGDAVSEPTGFVAAVTSLHVDGRVRESATRVLGTIDTDLATRALAVRLLDHVPQVREQAWSALSGRMTTHAAELVLDTLLAGRGRIPAAAAIADVRSALSSLPGGLAVALEALRSSESRRVRRWAFERAHEQGLLTESTLIEAAVGDRDQWVQATSASWLMQASPEALLPLLGATSVEARLVALTRLPAELLDEAALVRALTDKAPRMREQARWRSRRLQFDHLTLYRDLATSATATPLHRAAAIDALASIGDESDQPVVRAALVDPNARVRAAAVSAVATRFDASTAVSLLAPMLDDPSGRVSAAAATQLARIGDAPPTIVEHAWQSDRTSSRRAAWRLARSAGGWHRVEADLRASTDGDPQLASLGESAIRAWLVVGAATTYGRGDDDQRTRISTHLAASSLDEHLKDVIAFHAGLRR